MKIELKLRKTISCLLKLLKAGISLVFLLLKTNTNQSYGKFYYFSGISIFFFCPVS